MKKDLTNSRLDRQNILIMKWQLKRYKINLVWKV